MSPKAACKSCFHQRSMDQWVEDTIISTSFAIHPDRLSAALASLGAQRLAKIQVWWDRVGDGHWKLPSHFQWATEDWTRLVSYRVCSNSVGRFQRLLPFFLESKFGSQLFTDWQLNIINHRLTDYKEIRENSCLSVSRGSMMSPCYTKLSEFRMAPGTAQGSPSLKWGLSWPIIVSC